MLLFQRVKFSARVLILLFIFSFGLLYLIMKISEKPSQPVVRRVTYLMRTSLAPTVLRLNKTSKPALVHPAITHDNGIFRFGSGTATTKLAVVLCGKRLNQTIVTLKSAIILSRVPLHYIIMADEENMLPVKDSILQWPSSVLQRLSFEIHPVTFPNGSDGEEWKKLFKLCACQRLFLPSLLDHIDSLIYVDTDVLFLSPVDDLWKHFTQMNSSHIAGLAPEHEDFATGWYNRFARHPYYKPLGVNSGVMLMNLTRMREFKWESQLQPVMMEYKLKIVWGDQDIINIIFHNHSERLYIFSCDWNFRPDHCMYSSVCKAAEDTGVKLIHGNRGVYQNHKQPVFKAMYEAMENFELDTSLETELLGPMKKLIAEANSTNCGKISAVLTKSLEKYVAQTPR